jgi:hypothetical protein
LLKLTFGFNSGAVFKLFQFVIIKDKLADLRLPFIQYSLQFFNLLVPLLDVPLQLRIIGLRDAPVFEIFLERVYFPLFDFHLSDELLKLVAIDTTPVLFFFELFVFTLVLLQHFLQFHVFTVQTVQFFFVMFDLLYVALHLVLYFCADAALSVHFQLVEGLLVLVFQFCAVFL